jgi:Tol biopolymer transport system component
VFGGYPADRRVTLPFDPYVDGAHWSSDGTRVAFVREGSLYVAKADGSDPEQLADEFFAGAVWAPLSQPVWAPDGRHIAVLGATEVGGNRVFIVDVAAGTVEQVPGLDGYFYSIAWSPDGQRLALSGVVFRLRSAGLLVASIDGSQIHAIYAGHVDSFEWSLDSRRIVFASEGPGKEEDPAFRICTNSGWDIESADSNGGGRTRLTGWRGYDYWPVLSPDGGWVAFSSDRPIEWKPNMMCRPTDPLPQIESPENGAIWLTRADGTATHIGFQAGAGHDATPFAWFADPTALDGVTAS